MMPIKLLQIHTYFGSASHEQLIIEDNVESEVQTILDIALNRIEHSGIGESVLADLKKEELIFHKVLSVLWSDLSRSYLANGCEISDSGMNNCSYSLVQNFKCSLPVRSSMNTIKFEKFCLSKLEETQLQFAIKSRLSDLQKIGFAKASERQNSVSHFDFFSVLGMERLSVLHTLLEGWKKAYDLCNELQAYEVIRMKPTDPGYRAAFQRKNAARDNFLQASKAYNEKRVLYGEAP